MKLNRTPNPLDRNTRNSDNENWDIIEGEFKKVGDTFNSVNNRIDNVIDEVSDEALKKVVDSAKLNWKEPVENFSGLPTNAQIGDTRMDKSTGKVYRYDGANWVEIQQIDAGPVNELDNRLSSKLEKTVRDGVTLSDFENIQEAIDYAVNNNLPNIYLDTEEIGVHDVDFKGLNIIGSNTKLTGSPDNVKSSKGVTIKGFDQSNTQYGVFENLSGTITSKVVHKVSNDEINVFSKKPFSNEYLEFQFRSGIFTENNSAGESAELLRLVGVKNITHAYSQLVTPKDKSSGWDEYTTNIGIDSNRSQDLIFNRHTSPSAWIEFDVYVNDHGEFNLGFYATNGSSQDVKVKSGNAEITNFSVRAVEGPYILIKKINSNLQKGIRSIRIERESNSPIYVCSNMYLLHETPKNANIDRVAFFDDGNDYISHQGALDYAMLDDEGTYWGSYHGGETRSSFKLILDGVNYSASGHNGKFIPCTKMEIAQTTQIGGLYRSRTSQQIGRDGYFDFRFALNGDANLRTIYTTMTTAANAFDYVMYPRLQNVSANGEYNFGRANKIVQVNNSTDQSITTLLTRYENENNSQGGLFIRTTQGAYNKVYYGPVIAGMRNIKELHGENTRIFE